jgi:hypothetical protein
MNVNQTQGQLTYEQTQKYVNYVCLYLFVPVNTPRCNNK